MPTKIGLHAFHIIIYLHEFFELILFLTPLVQKEILAKFEISNISETGEPTPTKTGVHALDINPYLHQIFESILKGKFDQI